VTLSIVRYGNVTAANPTPRMLAAIEALSGQLYLGHGRCDLRCPAFARGGVNRPRLTLRLPRANIGLHAACLATVWPQPCEDGDICRRTSADDRCLLSREDATLAYDRGCPRTRGDVLLIRRLWVRVPPPELKNRR
jgi:hypothetical protein